MLRREISHVVRGIERDANKLNPVSAIFSLQARKSRHFLTTRRAPGCPEIYDQRLSVPLGERHRLSFRVVKLRSEKLSNDFRWNRCSRTASLACPDSYINTGGQRDQGQSDAKEEALAVSHGDGAGGRAGSCARSLLTASRRARGRILPSRVLKVTRSSWGG